MFVEFLDIITEHNFSDLVYLAISFGNKTTSEAAKVPRMCIPVTIYLFVVWLSSYADPSCTWWAVINLGHFVDSAWIPSDV